MQTGTVKKTSIRGALLVLVFLVPLGFFTKHYVGPADLWANNSFGGLLYEVFWCVIGALIFPRARPLSIVISVSAITCGLEVLQLFDWQVLRWVRSFYLGQILIGTTFAVSDMLYNYLGRLKCRLPKLNSIRFCDPLNKSYI